MTFSVDDEPPLLDQRQAMSPTEPQSNTPRLPEEVVQVTTTSAPSGRSSPPIQSGEVP
jgi:hypothetical protein